MFSSSINLSVVGKGKVTQKVLPLPALLETVIVPPSKSTSPFVIGSPNPKPSVFVSDASRSNGRNIRDNMISFMPIPVSFTSKYKCPSP